MLALAAALLTAVPAPPQDAFVAPPARRLEPIERWTIDRELEAALRAEAAFVAGAYRRAERIAAAFARHAAVTPDLLDRPDAWTAASRALSNAVHAREPDRPRHLAAAAVALGADDDARRWIDVELDALGAGGAKEGFQRATKLAEVAEALGDGPRALAAHRLRLVLPRRQGFSDSGLRFEATLCAIRVGELDAALAWAEEQEASTGGSQARKAKAQREAIAAVVADPGDARARYRVIRSYWLETNARQWRRAEAIVALEDLAADFALDDWLQVEVARQMVRLLLEDDQPVEARERIERLAATGRHDVDALADLWSRLGAHWRRSVRDPLHGRSALEKTLDAYGRALDLYDGPRDESETARWARINAALANHVAGEQDEAIALLLPILEWARNPKDPADLWMDLSAHDAALYLSRCYEAKDELQTALGYARASMDEFPPRSSCGTCLGSMKRRSTGLIARLEAKAAEGR